MFNLRLGYNLNQSIMTALSILARTNTIRQHAHQRPGRKTLYTAWKKVRRGPCKVGDRVVNLTGWHEDPDEPTRNLARAWARGQVKKARRYGRVKAARRAAAKKAAA